MRAIPVVSMDEVLPHLSERGQMEWELAVTKAQLTRALADPSEVVESGHIPTPELSPLPADVPSPVPADVPATNELTTSE